MNKLLVIAILLSTYAGIGQANEYLIEDKSKYLMLAASDKAFCKEMCKTNYSICLTGVDMYKDAAQRRMNCMQDWHVCKDSCEE